MVTFFQRLLERGVLVLAAHFGLAVRGAAGDDGVALLPPEPARLEVLAGWVRIANAKDVVLLTPTSPSFALDTTAYLELGTLSRARILRAGSSDVSLTGLTGLDYRLEGDDARAPTLTFRRIDVAEFDIRRGLETVVLPRGQVLRPRRGLFRLEGRVGGGVHCEHRAGDAIELDLGGRYSFELGRGFRRTLPERIDPYPATYRGPHAG